MAEALFADLVKDRDDFTVSSAGVSAMPGQAASEHTAQVLQAKGIDCSAFRSQRIKRWVKDIPTLESMRHQWNTVQQVECGYLRSLPQGEPFPADAGTPPPP